MYFIRVTRGLYSSMNTMFTFVYDKETVTSRITLGMSIYSLKMLWRDCTNYNFVWVFIFHDNQISDLGFLYVSWLNDTYSNWTATEKTCLRWFVTIKAQTSLCIHAVSLATLSSAFWEESSLDLPRAKKKSIFYLACLAKGTGLRLALSETQKTGFLASWPVLLARQL